ncbi:hypothetical protein [Proteiniphilum sp. X52]|uniref:hypothetical protein n=1 Tax=Proteiniphilum sp. X52 TaxID=2382159 RepID=UPI000F09EF25|nr:hypothetical protein [Proteiniphilum sp. X52]RNC66062.1 hypothetical protein D7D25_03715 [Proteiniphilum sp. X52]
MKSSRKVPFIFVFCLANIFMLTSFTGKYSKEKKTNLFEYGSVMTSEDNLKNLFKNFPIFIENGKDIDFISYRFVGTIRDKKDAKKYVQKNFDDLIPIGWLMSYPDKNGHLKETSYVRLDIQPIRETKSELKKMAKTISEEYIHPGDEVYMVSYVFNLQKHVHYIFINPTTKKVLLKGNIFGIEIPSSHFENIESRKNKP